MSTPHMPQRIESLVEQRIRAWRLDQDQSRARKQVSTPPPPPVITISRDVGARGLALAKRLAHRFGFALWDRQIVHAIAEETGVRESLLETLDEHARGALAEVVVMLTDQEQSSADLAYAEQLASVVHTVAHHGSAVIVGRGGAWLVPGDRALHVRITAPLDVRARWRAGHEGVEFGRALRDLQRRDRERVSFCEKHFGEDPGQARHYDLVINTASLSLDVAEEVVATAYEGKFPSWRAGDAHEG